ncbi:MAG TPA: uracil-DNA glycosylase, partial [Candidatus Angelobacter sp.]|nr:uracil-DNA glycosylase [Candidatus Angelobacter sp.]
MPKPLDPQTKKQLAARVKYYKEMGIHDFYRQAIDPSVEPAVPPVDEAMPAKPDIAVTLPSVISDKPSALKLIRADIGDCTRCRLHKGRTNLVFGVGNVNADLMFVGEGPG